MEYIIFGAGNNAAQIIEYLSTNGQSIKYIVDNDEKKWGTKILGVEVRSTADLRNEVGGRRHILISVSACDSRYQIMGQLNEMGFNADADYSDGLKLARFSYELPGRVSGKVDLDEGQTSIRTFDNSSRLFFSTDHSRIFRGISKGYAAQYLKIVDVCKEKGLFGKYIVETKVVNNEWGSLFEAVLEHELVEPISYPFEWPPAMFCDYVTFMVDMIKQLARADIAIWDAHALNATFSKGNFLFLDFGAIKPGITPKTALLEFIDTHLIPFVLIYKNQIPKAYLYMKNPGIEYTLTDVKGYLKNYEVKDFMVLLDALGGVHTNEDVISFMEKIENFMQSLDRIISETRWDKYQDDEWAWATHKEQWSEKMKSVAALIEAANPETLIDLAGNMGWYGTFPHKKVKYATVMDWDYRCIEFLWKKIRTEGIENVTPLYMSLISPTLDYYRDEMIGNTGITPWRHSAIRRFKADLAIALAIIHHLAFSQQMDFREIIEQLAIYTKRYLIVEFIDQSDPYISDWLKDGFEWYSEENFVEELRQKFVIISIQPSTPIETRKIYFCEKRV